MTEQVKCCRQPCTSVLCFFSSFFVVCSLFFTKPTPTTNNFVFSPRTTDTQPRDGPPSILLYYFSLDTCIGVTDATKNSRHFAVTSTTCSTLFAVFKLFFPPIDPAHAVSVPIRHPSDKICSYKLRDIRKKTRQIQDTRCKSGILIMTCVWRPAGLFPGTWRRGSWHFQVVSVHLQSIMDLCPLHTHFCFSFLSKRSGRREVPCIYIYLNGAYISAH